MSRLQFRARDHALRRSDDQTHNRADQSQCRGSSMEHQDHRCNRPPDRPFDQFVYRKMTAADWKRTAAPAKPKIDLRFLERAA